MITKLKYTHLPLNEEVDAFAGYYVPEKEVRMEYGGREIMYVTGHVVVEATCSGESCDGSCATANYWYAIVPGYVLDWQGETNEHGLLVTEFEQITDRAAQEELQKLILDKEAVNRVDFW